MKIIPAIDIIGGKVVRLFQGKYDKKTHYSDDPVKVAKKWEQQGAEWIHVVDLDGARAGAPKNADIIGDICKAVKVPVQSGGGLRNLDSVRRMIDKGVMRVIIGTRAYKDPDFIKKLVKEFGNKIAVSIDAMGKVVVSDGWKYSAMLWVDETAAEMVECGVSTLIFTNVMRDGTLMGIEKEWVKKILDIAGNSKIIIAGGVSTFDDIKMLAGLNEEKLYGVIVGKAVYEGTLDLLEAIKYLKTIG
ncbi:MAG: 1-(5-phosphoribosyl)-5-[(5-phosphoribosylamino)methylideneamino]imidazole-4-carboxamide isomerase [Candidatus Omnitrophica bacterium]|nr:1-(5-phosphoribosyl)-5-[(5-phosphoribosylamino)methylideneamino]imidazole-4-carboxamide isomerase [Candidatus Omnitrophota bacterium]MBU1128649.1 1-(5-phosphoribosyl)-5-[(5-phosphoribosylamino)methylideneamino]imidazole-4-carboxamide isomerase [Candidatus Omnitrophota bacterium]MBU1785030.1 1-(5-phosphoribosyl)-5-[(5-phosphoribosylamino)methylideneamino]imidazole-4-carboxamide isomerase [Candidatus Omnitrophota bacterium]MBU1852221.1 1-(5-phosphoribosyl)-5-[(5-phosphoribosylamino)methylidenea